MRLISKALAAVGFSLLALSAAASPASPQSGLDYRTLDQPQQTAAGNKVEVTEFFWYSCPHCNALESGLEDWVKKQGDKIVFKRVPIAFRDSFIPQQKLYYTLEALGQVDELHKKVFHAIHVERQRLDTDNEIADFIGKQPGFDKKKFLDMYNSFAVQTKVRQATQLQAAYQVDGVPLLAVDGRYLTSPSIVGASIGNKPEPVLQSATFQVMDFLLAKAAKERAPAAAAAAAPAKEAAKKK